MALTHSTAAKQAASNAVVDLIDLGSANAEGMLRLRDNTTVIADLPLDNPAFGNADANGLATAAAIAAADAVADGDVDNFQVLDRDEAVVFSGTAGLAHAITAVSQANDTFTVAADLSGVLTQGTRFRVSGSTGNDGVYIVVSTSGAGPTVITVVEEIPNAVADGLLHPYDLTLQNTSILAPQTVTVSSLTYDSNEQ
jgi:hypothetical protein